MAEIDNAETSTQSAAPHSRLQKTIAAVKQAKQATEKNAVGNQ